MVIEEGNQNVKGKWKKYMDLGETKKGILVYLEKKYLCQ